MTRTEIIDTLRAGLLDTGLFIAVDDLSAEGEGEVYLCAHTGDEETDDTPLTHVNFTPKEIATDDDSTVRYMIESRVALAVQSSQERKGQIARLEANKLAERSRLAEVQHVVDIREAAEADRLAKIEAARAVLTALGGW